MINEFISTIVLSQLEGVEELIGSRKKIAELDGERENLTLLNPLTVLEFIKDEKINEYHTLPLAETGNAFGGVDV